MNKKTYNVIIIGGGPAGLSLAYMLKKLSIDYLIIEKGSAGNTWFNMPDGLKVLSPLWTNILSGSKFPLLNSYYKPSAREYASYLSKYKEKNDLNIIENTEVINIEKKMPDNKKYTIETKIQQFTANIVVCASGYFNNPYRPTWENGNDHSIAQIHSSDYRNPQEIEQQLNKKGKVLIIGSRISAGQIMLELYDAGFSIAVSHREKIQFREKSLLMTIKEFIYYPYEQVKIKFSPSEKRDSADIMEGGKSEHLLSKGNIKKHPVINKIHNKKVIFSDHSEEYFDLIIYATGYQPSLNYIDQLRCTKGNHHVPSTQTFESKEEDNLFFLGFDNLKNFRSRYLRGIKSDSIDLAFLIKKKIKNRQFLT